MFHRVERMMGGLCCVLGAVACGERAEDTAAAPAPNEPSVVVNESPAVQSDAPITEGESVPRSLCPDCSAWSEVYDYGDRTSCVIAERTSSIDAAQAAEIGFDVDTIERLVERELRAPFRWIAQESDSATPATGYEARTWIEGTVAIDSYDYVGLSPELCTGYDCTINGDQVRCSDRLELQIHAQLRTLDGGIELQPRGYALVGRSGFPFSEYPAGSLRANLSEVTGSLELHPDPALPIVAAAMFTDLWFKVEQIEGDIRPQIIQSATRGVPIQSYVALEGHWPDLR